MRYLFVRPEQVGNECIELDREQEHRLRRVLRLSGGDRLRVRLRGSESFLWTRVSSSQKGRIRLVIEKEVQGSEALIETIPARRGVNLAVSILKGRAFERVFRSSVELGVETFTPLRSNNTVVRELSQRERNRLIKIGDESCQQCGRYDPLPLLDDARPGAYAAYHRALGHDVLMFHEVMSPPCLTSTPRRDLGLVSSSVALMFGPEGGWDAAEIAECRNHGARVIRVPGHILRAETAASTLTALVVFHGVLDHALSREVSETDC